MILMLLLEATTAYSQEIKDLKSKGSVKSSSKITSLNPVLEGNGVLRVKERVLSPPAAINPTNQFTLQRITSFAATTIRHTHE